MCLPLIDLAQLYNNYHSTHQHPINPLFLYQQNAHDDLGYAILLSMNSDHWSGWMGKLQRRHLTSIVLPVLDGAGPLKVLLAQGMLAVSPLIDQKGHSEWVAFAEMLEDPVSSRQFAEMMRQEKP